MRTTKNVELANPAQLNNASLDVLDNDLTAFAERLILEGANISLAECFAAAADLSAYLTAIRNKSMVLGSRYVPKAVQTLGLKAVEGDLDATKLLFDYLGLRVKTPIAQINTQVNIQTPVLRDVITIDDAGNIVADMGD